MGYYFAGAKRMKYTFWGSGSGVLFVSLVMSQWAFGLIGRRGEMGFGGERNGSKRYLLYSRDACCGSESTSIHSIPSFLPLVLFLR